MGGKNTGNYITGGLQTVAGAAATAFGAPEIGIPLMTGGVGELAGTGAGGQRGGQIGEMAGLAAGGLGMGGAGLAGMGPLANSLSAAPALQSVAQNPAVSAIPPMNVGGMQLPGLAAGQQPLLGQGAQALQQADYPLASKLGMIPQYSGGGAGGGSGGVMDFLKSPGGGQLASGMMQGMNQPQPPPQPPPPPPQLRPQLPGQPMQMPQPAVANVPKPPGTPSAGGDPTQMLAMLKMMLGGSGGLG